MKTISADKIKDAVAGLCVQANTFLRKDVFAALNNALKKEKNKRAKEILKKIIQNALIAKEESLAICQDTGMPCVFVELGQEVKISGGLKSAINRGIESGYRKGFLRNSIIKNPLLRGKSGYQPAVTHIDVVRGNKLKITILPKGFGCENKAQLKMFNPTATIAEVKKFIIDAVISAGPDACPPFVLGVGIGGTADYAMFLAKKALIKKVSGLRPSVSGQAAKLGRELFSEINKLNIGPMGLGGRATVLAVNIETYPTHIAGFPVAANICCHALRSATVVL
jgi:fumarate hydratase subunit alpha